MSVFGDFQRVWLQRFPNSILPAAWEEDVRANLAKHKQKVALLKEELEKEEFYVEYLERLLSDVEQHKRGADDSPKTIGNVSLISDSDKVTITDNLSKVNIATITSFPSLTSLFCRKTVNLLMSPRLLSRKTKQWSSKAINAL